jgi:predicted RNA binding protein YcfA (HicA-like mRNA interferase family)
VDSREVIRLLRRAGWHEVSQAGSHKPFQHPDRKGRATVPHAKRDIPLGTLRSIEKQTGISLKR